MKVETKKEANAPKKAWKKMQDMRMRTRKIALGWLEKSYGKRCKSFFPGCPCCDIYRAFDTLFFDINKEYSWNDIHLKRGKKHGKRHG